MNIMKKIILMALIALAPVQLDAQSFYENIISHKWFVPAVGALVLGTSLASNLFQFRQNKVLVGENKAYKTEMIKFIYDGEAKLVGSFFDCKKGEIICPHGRAINKSIGLKDLVDAELAPRDLIYNKLGIKSLEKNDSSDTSSNTVESYIAKLSEQNGWSRSMPLSKVIDGIKLSIPN